MNYAYARVSTDYQEHDRQKEILKQYDIPADNYFFEIISGGKAARTRPIFEGLIKKVKKGDVIYFTEMSRMGRSTQDLINTVDDLQKAGVSVVFIKENLKIGSAFDSDPVSTLIFHIFASFAQFERELISQRVVDGLAATKANGTKLGRPKSKVTEDKISDVIKMLQANKTQVEIAKELNVTQPYVSYIKKQYITAIGGDNTDGDLYDI